MQSDAYSQPCKELFHKIHINTWEKVVHNLDQNSINRKVDPNQVSHFSSTSSKPHLWSEKTYIFYHIMERGT